MGFGAGSESEGRTGYKIKENSEGKVGQIKSGSIKQSFLTDSLVTVY